MNPVNNTLRWQSNLSLADEGPAPQICDLRHEIDRLDADIASLLAERFSIAQKIGELKAEAKMPVLDNKRELEVLQRAANSTDDLAVKDSLAKIFSVIMDESRKLQSRVKSDKARLAFPKVLIVGVGLIGGSLIRQINKILPDTSIFGCDEAIKLLPVFEAGMIEKGDSNFVNFIHEASLIILASNPQSNMKLLEQMAPFLKHGQLVVDVTSTKMAICDLAENLNLNGAEFIGGHPFMGSEKQGFEASAEVKADGSVFCLIPTAKSSEVSIGRVSRWLSELNFRVHVMDAETHDAIAARISHLVQLVAVALGSSIKESLSEDDQKTIPGIAGKTFRELQRLMNSPADMWFEIVQQNSYEVIESLDDLIRQLQNIRHSIQQNDQAQLQKQFASASQITG